MTEGRQGGLRLVRVKNAGHHAQNEAQWEEAVEALSPQQSFLGNRRKTIDFDRHVLYIQSMQRPIRSIRVKHKMTRLERGNR